MMSKTQRIAAGLVIGVVILLLAQLALAGEPQRVTRAPGLFELRLPSIPAGADVSWEAKQPLTLDFRQYEGGAAFVSYATSGELVIVSDVIDWESKKRDKTTWIIKIEGTPPTPPGPVLPPVEPPKPDTATAPLPDVPGFRVLMIYESGTLPPDIPKEQHEIPYLPTVRDWLSKNTTPENGWAGWRVGDPHSVPQSSNVWARMLAIPRTEALPWLVVNNGDKKVGYSGPMPKNAADFMKLVEGLK